MTKNFNKLNKNKNLTLLTTLFILFSSMSLVAAETDSQETKSAKPLDTVTLPFPSELRISGNEGWVQLAYIVDKEGNVKDPIIEASVGGMPFEKTAIEALQSLKYSPAIFKGSKVEEAVSGEVVEFLLEQTFEGVDQGFSNTYTNLLDATRTGDKAAADAAFAKLEASQDLTVHEISMLEVMRAYRAAESGDQVKQLQHLRKASVRDGMHLSKEMLSTVLQTRFALAAKQSLFHEAFYAYNLLEQIDPENDKLTTLAMAMVPMQKAIETGNLIKVDATIGDLGYWTYTPMRRVFAFAAAEEGVKEFEPRCARKNQRFTVTTTSEWKIPDSWGACTVVIYGTPGAKFSLYEHADI
ncbi:MAG: hypothetical protein HKN88_02730 [Gammaproteobacteria bacterium]|nr:energy transducer TonB [Gammaproteobacteria bacterium]NNC96967.1 hypothetical protein [Gammaproteobacteria bacterium]NNM13412.1 hypothetical protein [Gammaproteobacteria bacterium]